MSESETVQDFGDGWKRVEDRPVVDSAVVVERVEGGEDPGIIEAIWERHGTPEQVEVEIDGETLRTNPDRVNLL